MRKNLFLGALAGLALIGGISCSSEAPVEEEQNVLQLGDPTCATFNVYFNNAQTRAAGDDNADAVEQTISEIHFYIFSGGVLERQVKQLVTAGQTDGIPVPVSTGTKTIYAVTTNILEGNEEIVEKKTKAVDFEKILTSAICDTKVARAFNIAASNHFVMIGKESRVYITKCTEEEASLENPVKIGIDRAAAKVQVVYPDNSTGANTENTAVSVSPLLNANFSNPLYDVAQSIKQMCVYTDITKNVYSPIGTTDGTGTYTGFSPVSSETMQFISAPKTANPAFEVNRYTGEVVTENPVTGNSTFAVVKLSCSPKNLYDGKSLTNGTFYVLAYNYKTSGTWSFVSGEDRKVLYFASSTDAEAYKNAQGEVLSNYTVYEYPNGATYYRIDLVHDMDLDDGDTELHRILRNNYYRAKVKEIDGLGSPTVEGLVPEDPDTPIQKDSYLSAEITINPWYAHDWDVNLE